MTGVLSPAERLAWLRLTRSENVGPVRYYVAPATTDPFFSVRA